MFSFSDLARRVHQLDLDVVGEVVRFFLRLAEQGEPPAIHGSQERRAEYYKESSAPQQHVRERLRELAGWFWIDAIRQNEGTTASPRQVEMFLEEHAGIRYTPLDGNEVRRWMQALAIPEDVEDCFKSPTFGSQRLSRSGPAAPKAPNDLTERMVGAYYALKYSDIERIRARIADALQSPRLDGEPGPVGSGHVWTEDGVWDRVRKFKGKIEESCRRGGRSTQQVLECTDKQLRELSGKAVFLYRFRRERESGEAGKPNGKSTGDAA